MKLTVVLVTYNRKNDLMKALDCYDKQVLKMNTLIVVNNASNDGTFDFLEEWKSIDKQYKKIVVHSDVNTGGSGGFYRGLEEALDTECDYIFLADDDAFADKNMIKNLDDFYGAFIEKEKVAAMCTSVVNNGVYDLLHRRKVHKGLCLLKNICIDNAEYNKDYFEVDDFSFVGAVISKSVIKKIGLPKKEYFIYFDDTEYSTRIKKEGKIYCIPNSKMFHNTNVNAATSWRDYYVLRNYLDLLKNHYPKKYYYSYMILEYVKKCTIFGKLFKGRTSKQIKMFKKAIEDARNGNLGKDSVYCPGADIEKV